MEARQLSVVATAMMLGSQALHVSRRSEYNYGLLLFRTLDSARFRSQNAEEPFPLDRACTDARCYSYQSSES